MEVDDSKSKATISSGKITFLLEKKEPGITWDNVQHEKYKDKDFAMKEREKAVLYSQERAEKLREKKAAERDQQQKFAVRQQMQVIFSIYVKKYVHANIILEVVFSDFMGFGKFWKAMEIDNAFFQDLESFGKGDF